MPGTVPSAESHVLKAQVFKALSHPIRLRLVDALLSGESSVQGLQKALNIDQPIVSQQLARLRASGIVVSRKEGTTMFYAVTDPMLRDLQHVMKRILDRRRASAHSRVRELAHETGSRRRGRTRV
jgi:DNA-binding transcriptional ArsR family regulator